MQSLPKLATWNESLFMVWSGYQDYFYSLYDKKLTVSQTRKIVPDVVKAIEEHIEVSLLHFATRYITTLFKVSFFNYTSAHVRSNPLMLPNAENVDTRSIHPS